jgi:hypothetical protein
MKNKTIALLIIAAIVLFPTVLFLITNPLLIKSPGKSLWALPKEHTRKDGWKSHAEHKKGACSHHGGVSSW